jgi:hypothetical protein
MFACAFVGLGLGAISKENNIEHKIADGEIKCEYFYKKVVCWNPKEESVE